MGSRSSFPLERRHKARPVEGLIADRRHNPRAAKTLTGRAAVGTPELPPEVNVRTKAIIAYLVPLALPVLLTVTLTTPAFGQNEKSNGKRIVIRIDNPNFRPYPLAIPEAQLLSKGTSTEAQRITQTLRWCLRLAPTFKVLDPKSYLADPRKEGLVAASINFADWLNVGAEGLVKAGVTQTPERLKVDFRFFDVTNGRTLISKSYSGTPKDAQKLGRQFADDVVGFLTGNKGVFETRIAAVQRSKSGRELWTMDIDGTNIDRVTSNGSINLLPAWTRDGQSLLFTSYLRHNPNLFTIPVTGGRPRQLSGERGLNTGASMSPDGKRIALTLTRDGNSEIYVMNADGTGLKRLTNEWAIDSSPSWSPDGKRIAFVSSRWGDPHIFVMNADGSKVRRVTDRGTYNQTPDWSPRGDLIAFTARDERNVFDIFTVNPDTKEIRRLTQDQGNNEEPSFSPDGNLIAFTSTRERRSQLWIMALDGSNQTRITKAGGFSTPAWSPYLP